MEEKTKEPLMKLTLKSYLLVAFIVIAIIIIGVMISNQSGTNVNKLNKFNKNDYHKEIVDDKVYYIKKTDRVWSGEYQEDEIDSEVEINYCEVASYVRYKQIIHDINNDMKKSKFEDETRNVDTLEALYSDPRINYLVLAYCSGNSNSDITIYDIFEDDDSVVVLSRTESNGFMVGGSGYFIAIPVGVKSGTNVIDTIPYSEEQVENLKNYGTTYNPDIYYYNESGENYYMFPEGKFKEISLDYSGDYDIEYYSAPEGETEDISNYMTYDEYADFCKKWNITQKYRDEKLNYIVVSDAKPSDGIEGRFVGYEENERYIYVYTYVKYNAENEEAKDKNAFIVVLPTNGEKKTVYKRTTLDHNGYMEAKNPPMAFKPMIYLYPEEDNTLVRVKLGSKEKISTSYPKYVDGWSVIAEKNGTLKLENSDREYYGLYWEGLNDIEENFDEGFCISGKESAEFLEEKLRILGLNDKEAEEFIVYWLPKLEESKYNLIRFETIDEINENMALEISPKPDTIIRIIMDFKGIENPINVKEQKLNEVNREGFTVVEWGGTEIN